jgi:hypothetical protein
VHGEARLNNGQLLTVAALVLTIIGLILLYAAKK